MGIKKLFRILFSACQIIFPSHFSLMDEYLDITQQWLLFKFSQCVSIANSKLIIYVDVKHIMWNKAMRFKLFSTGILLFILMISYVFYNLPIVSTS